MIVKWSQTFNKDKLISPKSMVSPVLSLAQDFGGFVCFVFFALVWFAFWLVGFPLFFPVAWILVFFSNFV